MTERYTEPSRDLPVVESADVVVCGGVPAGVAAAIAAETGLPPHEVPFDEVRRGIAELAAPVCKRLNKSAAGGGAE